MERIVILGCGGHAKSMMDTIEAGKAYEIAGFVGRDVMENYIYRGYRCIGTDEDLPQIYREGIRYACIGIGYLGKGDIRERLYYRLREIGFILPPIVDATAVIARDAAIGEGGFVAKRAVVNAGARIERMSIVNTGAIVEHDVCVGEFSHVAVAAVLCGEAGIGKGCLIGANAVVIQGMHIGEHVIVGAGTVVTKDLEDHMVYTVGRCSWKEGCRRDESSCGKRSV